MSNRIESVDEVIDEIYELIDEMKKGKKANQKLNEDTNYGFSHMVHSFNGSIVALVALLSKITGRSTCEIFEEIE